MQSNVDSQFIIEFVRVGDSVKVSAIDPKTGTETCIVAPAKGSTQKQMQDIAIQKLKYVLSKGD